VRTDRYLERREGGGSNQWKARRERGGVRGGFFLLMPSGARKENELKQGEGAPAIAMRP